MTSEEAWEAFVGAMRHGSPFATQEERAKAYADARVAEATKRIAELEAALRDVSVAYKKTLAWLVERGIKFERAPTLATTKATIVRDCERWENIAFWIYTDLAETCDKARVLLEASDD